MLNGLHLFAGYGGADEALGGYVRPVAYCEVDEGAQRILLHRMRKGEIGPAPIWDDVLTLQGKHLEGEIHIITAGWPCKQISVAGNREGIEGPDSRLFFEVARLARELRPQFLFLENSPNLFCGDMGYDRVLGELATQGFHVEWGVLSAFDVGAPHYRERAWILAAHPDRLGIRIESKRVTWSEGQTFSEFTREGLDHADPNGQFSDERRRKQSLRERGIAFNKRSLEAVFPFAHAYSERLERRIDSWEAWKVFALGGGGGGGVGSWPPGVPEPTIRGLDDGPESRRIRAHRKIGVTAGGNGWVVQSAREAFLRLSGLKGGG